MKGLPLSKAPATPVYEDDARPVPRAGIGKINVRHQVLTTGRCENLGEIRGGWLPGSFTRCGRRIVGTHPLVLLTRESSISTPIANITIGAH